MKESNYHCRIVSFRVLLLVLVLTIASILIFPVTVLAADPTVSTGTTTNTTDNSVVLWGDITSFGDYTGNYVYLSFDYATDEYYTEFTDYDKSTTEIEWTVSDGLTSFSTQITGLPNSCGFHYRAKLRYSTSTVYGSDAEFYTTVLRPDAVPEIHVLQAYKDLIETGDCLFVILANIPYINPPSVPVSRAFTWSLMEDDFEVGWNTGYAMNDNGYNFNIYSLYFAAADAIDWGNTTDYSIALSGSIDVFPSNPPYYDTDDDSDYAVMDSTWVDSSDYNETLAEDLIDLARQLEQEWQISLVDEQETRSVLSGNGEKLFRNAIPGVQNMAPSIFYIQGGEFDTDGRTWGTSLTDAYKARFFGVDGEPGGGDDNWMVWGLVGVSDWFNVPFLLIIGLLCIAACAYSIHISIKKFGSGEAGYVMSIIIILGFGILVMGLTAIALIGLFMVIISGWYLFMRRA